MVTYPWTNVFESTLDNFNTYREKYRKLSGGSIVAPLESDDDFVFNERLTEEHLESGDFSTSNVGARANAHMLSASYRKFTETVTTRYTDAFEYSTLTMIDFNEGEIEEQRIYKDEFKNNEVYGAEGFFEDLSYEHAITVIDTGAQSTIRFDPEIPYTHPANVSWEGETWGVDNVPVKYDSLQVIGDGYSYSTNHFERNIIVRIPNRYSIYNDFGKNANPLNDGWVEFETEGMLVTPGDGRVYYTSDVYSFKAGTAKTNGHYFYVDSDLNGFYETVYVLSKEYTVNRQGVPKYDVISVGLNYDGIHDFVPYEKLEESHTVSDFDNLARESRMFGFDWVYNFNDLQHCELLFKQKLSIWDEYKPKDQIFEIHKLVSPSVKNSRYSELFYEIRHESYSKAWSVYKKQVVQDIADQTFMATTAGILSATVNALVVAAMTIGTSGAGALSAESVGQLAGQVTYLLVYTLMTKFNIDCKIHTANSKERSETFYPVSEGVQEPTSLNEKSFFDRILQDTMAAAVLGHPGGYYTTVRGTESGKTYTGQLLVSPPNYARMYNMFGGFTQLLMDNLWNMGESNPDAFTALDFDDINLNYLLMTSELPFYNTDHYPYHIYENTLSLFDDYNQYSFNTLGALETQVRDQSNGIFDAIRPICIDGEPQYEFINSSQYETVLPQSILYRPVVLSQAWYDRLNPVLGYLTVKVRCKDYNNTYGVNAYQMNAVEAELYQAKVVLNENGFEYPIKQLYVDVITQEDDSSEGIGFFARDLLVNETDYEVEGGCVYFTKSIEAIISQSYPLFEDFLNQSWTEDLLDCVIFYRIRIVFDRFVPDTTDETRRLALAQATSYTIMDYFNQYNYAEISANMIAEVAYTETITFWSTLISAPLIFFGSYLTKSLEGTMAQASVQLAKSLIVAPVKEVFQEIVQDSYIEAFSEWIVDIAGLSEDLGFWLSSFLTSWREMKGALGNLAGVSGSSGSSFMNLIALTKAIATSDHDTIAAIEQMLEQQQAAAQIKEEQNGFWGKILDINLLKGALMTLASTFLGSFNFLTLAGITKSISTGVQLSPAAYAIYKTQQHAKRKEEIDQAVGTGAEFSVQDMLIDHLKPSELSNIALEINSEFNGQLPQVSNNINLNPDPRKVQRSELYRMLTEMRIINNFKDISFATEMLKLLYPEGYGGWVDPVSSLRQWGEDRGLNTEHLTFWGTPIQHEWTRTSKNLVRNSQYNDYSALLNEGVPLFPSFSPSTETTVENFLTKELQIPDLILEYNVFVNGKQVDLDFWSDFVIESGDKVIIAPYIGLLKEIQDIEAKIMLEGSKDWDKQQPLDLNFNERTTLYEFYYRLIDRAYTRASFQDGSMSIYTPHLKFLIDESIRILMDNNIINDENYRDRVKSLSKIVTLSQTGRALPDTFNKLRRGAKFDLTENYLMTWYAGMWSKIEDAYDRGDILSIEHKNVALYELNQLFNAQYKLYGIGRGKPSRAYLPIRQVYEALRLFIYEKTSICPDKSVNTFLSTFSFNPHWSEEYTYANPDYVPNLGTWNSLFSNIITEMETRFLDDLIPTIRSIQSKITDIILYFSSSPFTDSPNLPKTELLENIIFFQDMDFLTGLSIKDISFILFGHPDWDSRDQSISRSYVSNVYFGTEGIDQSTIEALLHRISTLTIDDFTTIGFGEGLDKNDLLVFKNHAKDTVYEWIKKYEINSYVGVGTTYRTTELRDLQLEVFGALWKAVAYREDDFFIPFSHVFEVFDLERAALKTYLTKPIMLNQETVKRLVGKLDNLILEESYPPSMSYNNIANLYPSLQDPSKIQAYQEAKDKLIEYQVTLQVAQDIWSTSPRGVTSWFESLFEPSSFDPRYTNAFYNMDSMYKAWLVIMQLFEGFGTDPISGENIPNAAFDKGDPSAVLSNHHMMRNNKMSMALYDIILTWGKGQGYHPDPYESFSALNGLHNQRLLKYRLRQLFELGINKDESTVSNSQWITEADFRAIFPDDLEYKVEYQGKLYKGSLYYLWNDVFTRESFRDKLRTMNDKVTLFREARDQGDNPYLAVLTDFQPAAEFRFLQRATKFTNQFWQFGSSGYSNLGHSAGELALIWQVYLMRVAFEL